MNLGGSLFQNLFGLIRLFLFIGLPAALAIGFSDAYHQVNPRELADALIQKNFVFQLPVLRQLAGVFALMFEVLFSRYLLPPVLASLMVLLASAFYVMDIYNLRTFGAAMRYVMASMFAINYPVKKIDLAGGRQTQVDARRERAEDEELIAAIGGPGIVQVEPGSGAFFRLLRGRLEWAMATNRFLEPFEMVAQEVDLNDHQGDREGENPEILAVTRDGIQVRLRDVHFRYRIRMSRTVRTPADPYPFERDALPRLILGLVVQRDRRGPDDRAEVVESWRDAVERAVTGQITDYIAANTIDFLTAPRTADWNPRDDLRNFLFSTSVEPLNRVGAELIWADVGHLEIVDDRVDDQRANLWAVPWAGDATATRAFGDAIRQSYREMGRAQAQAELIIGIANAFANLEGEPRSPQSVRRLLLARTAQMLDGLHENNRERQRRENA